jgi:hypothetical protein
MANESGKTTEPRKKRDWMTDKWRPMMAITYMAMNIFDFIVGPIMFNALQAWAKQPIVEWTPLTMSGGGMVHIAFGAILGAASWGRTIEKTTALRNPPEKPKDE